MRFKKWSAKGLEVQCGQRLVSWVIVKRLEVSWCGQNKRCSYQVPLAQLSP